MINTNIIYFGNLKAISSILLNDISYLVENNSILQPKKVE